MGRMPLPSPAVVNANWSAQIAAVAETEMTGNVSIFIPGTPGTFDPETDTETGGTPDALLAGLTAYSQSTGLGGTPARIQQISQPREASSSYEWSMNTTIIIQIHLTQQANRFTKA